MADLARMRFKNTTSPDEHGALVLSDDGTLRVEPSDEFRDAMARLEETALHRSRTYSLGIGGVLISLGALAIGLGWAAGRIFGKMGATLSEPRPVGDVEIGRDDGGGVHIQLKGLESRLQTVRMSWNGDEVLPCEADAFVEKFNELKQG